MTMRTRGTGTVELTRREDGMLLLRAFGELDADSMPQLQEGLARAEAHGGRRMVVDLTEVTFMDSLSLAAVIGARTRIGSGGRMAVCVESGSYALLVLEATGLIGALDVFGSRDEAVAFVMAG